MANPREVRGWVVYGAGVGVAFLMMAFRLFYGTTTAVSPSLLLEWVDVPFVIGVLAVALAGMGLQQALWYSLVKPYGWTLYVASLLMFAVATLLFYTLPAHLAAPTFFYLIFTAAVVLYVYTPALSWGSKVFTGIGIAGVGALLASSLYGPLTGSAPLVHPVVILTLGGEVVLLLALLRLMQFAVRKPAAATA